MNAGVFFFLRNNTHLSRWRRTVKGFMRSAVLVVGLLASPVALMAQAAAAATKIDSVATQTAANHTSINFVWTLVAGFLVMFMQAGFALVETGFTRSKN